MKSLGASLKYIREYKGLTQREVAELLNISTKTLYKLEADKEIPNQVTMDKIDKLYTEEL